MSKNQDTDLGFDEVELFLPKQKIGRWKNDEGIALFVVQFFNPEEKSLQRIFMPVLKYKELGVKKLLGQAVRATLGEDDEGRTTLEAVENLDKELSLV